MFDADARLDGERLLPTTKKKAHHDEDQRAHEASPLLVENQGSSVSENDTTDVWEHQNYLDHLTWRKKPSVYHPHHHLHRLRQTQSSLNFSYH